MRVAKVNTIEKALELKLRELYDIENQVEKSLRKLIYKAETPLLQEAFKRHLEETTEQIVRLDEAFRFIDVRPKKFRSEAIRGMSIDADVILDIEAPDEIRDLMLVGAGRLVEHFEMAAYLSALAYAKQEGHIDIQRLLQTNLQEEETMDKVLAKVSLELFKSLQ